MTTRYTITNEQVDANSPLTELLMKDRVKNNDDNHEERIVVLENNGNNWTSQNGRLITDTHMGSFNQTFLTDNLSTKELLQQIEDYMTFNNGFKYGPSSLYSYANGDSAWHTFGPTLTFTIPTWMNNYNFTLYYEVKCAGQHATLDPRIRVKLDSTVKGSEWLGTKNITTDSAFNALTTTFEYTAEQVLTSGAHTVTFQRYYETNTSFTWRGKILDARIYLTQGNSSFTVS
jgi:hypothetical protein